MGATREYPTPQAIVWGIGLSAGAFAVFTLMDCTVKALGGRYHVLEIVWLQAITALAVMLAVARCNGGMRRLRTRYLYLHILRGGLAVVSISLVFASYAMMPLADVYAVLFTIPLITAALGAMLLGERVGPTQLAIILAGFGGVLLMIAPSGEGFGGLGLLLPLGGAFVSALGYVLVRHMQATETTESFGVYTNLVVALATTPAMLFVFVMPTIADLMLAMLGGVLCALGSMVLVQAYRLAPVAVVAPFQYTQMPYAVLAGVVLFGDQAQPTIIAGGAIVAACGLFMLLAETQRIEVHRRSYRPAAQASQ
jgi:drug/metabolite transporter (DMT)-like permease